jgi:8-oxo-dGTP pyrophosphatase MutT (NUDIX family)
MDPWASWCGKSSSTIRGRPSPRSWRHRVFAAVRGDTGRLLLVRRLDNGNWELPGGQVDVGDTVVGALQREVAEEAGIMIDILGVSSVYTDPGYVIRSVAGRVRQPFTVCFHARPVSGTAAPRPDHVETTEAAWIDPAQLDTLPVHPAMRQWIDDALNQP